MTAIDALVDTDTDGDGASVMDGVPADLLAEINTAVVELIEGSTRRAARRSREPRSAAGRAYV